MTIRNETIGAVTVSRIMETVTGATTAETAAGLVWYSAFGDAITSHGRAHGLDQDTSIAIFACLSPQTSIARNWSNFRAIVADRSLARVVQCAACQRRKLAAWLDGSATAGDLLKGDKVGAFAANLAGDMERVTIDRHAVACANGFQAPTRSLTRRQYRQYELAYQTAAAMLDMAPAQCQAIAWVAWRRSKGIHDTGGIELVA